MPNQAELIYETPTYVGSLSSSEALPSPSSTSISEKDSFNQEWSASRPTIPIAAHKVIIKGDVPVWINNIVVRLNELLDLPVNWDSYGADKIHFRSAIYVIEMLTVLFNSNIPEPSIVPISNGGIQMEWHTNEANLEIDIQPDRTTVYYFHHEQFEDEEKEGEFKFYKGQLTHEFKECINAFMKYAGNQ